MGLSVTSNGYASHEVPNIKTSNKFLAEQQSLSTYRTSGGATPASEYLLINPFAMLSSPIPSFTVRTRPLSLPMLGAQEAVPQLPPASFRTIFFGEFIFKILPKVEVMEDFMKSILFKRSCTYTVRNHLYFGTALNCGGSLN